MNSEDEKNANIAAMAAYNNYLVDREVDTLFVEHKVNKGDFEGLVFEIALRNTKRKGLIKGIDKYRIGIS